MPNDKPLPLSEEIALAEARDKGFAYKRIDADFYKDPDGTIIPTCPSCGTVENGFLFFDLGGRNGSVECGRCGVGVGPRAPLIEGERIALDRAKGS
jgi:hypothetical protein